MIELGQTRTEFAARGWSWVNRNSSVVQLAPCRSKIPIGLVRRLARPNFRETFSSTRLKKGEQCFCFAIVASVPVECEQDNSFRKFLGLPPCSFFSLLGSFHLVLFGQNKRRQGERVETRCARALSRPITPRRFAFRQVS